MIGAAKKQILKPSEAKSGLQGLVKFKRSNGIVSVFDTLIILITYESVSLILCYSYFISPAHLPA